MQEPGNTNGFEFKSRKAASLASLPPLLFGTGIALISVVRGGPWFAVPSWRLYLSIGVGLTPIAVIALGALIAIHRRLPDWGWTWIGSTSMGFVLFVNTLADEMAEEGRHLTTEAEDAAIAVLILLGGATLIGVAAMRGWRQAGLLSIGLASTLGLSLCMAVTAAPFYRHDLALLGAPIGLLTALLVFHYTQGSDRSRIAVILSSGALNIGLVLVANEVWREWVLSEGRATPLLPLLLFSALLLGAGPLLGLMANPLQRLLKRA